MLKERKFKPSSAFGKPGSELYERRGRRSARRTHLATAEMEQMHPFVEAKEQFFKKLTENPQQSLNEIREGIIRDMGFNKDDAITLRMSTTRFDRDWSATQKKRLLAEQNPALLFKEVFGFDPADGELKTRVSACDIHFGLGERNWALLLEKGVMRRGEGGGFLGNYPKEESPKINPISKLKEYSPHIYSVSQLVEIEGGLQINGNYRLHELRHHFQSLWSTPHPVWMTHPSRYSMDFGIRIEIASKIIDGRNAFDNLRRFLKFYRKGALRNSGKRIEELRNSRKRIEEEGGKVRGLRWLLSTFTGGGGEIREIKRNIAEEREEMKKILGRFRQFERILFSESFQATMAEAQQVVPREILASYLESVNLARLETLLPQLIEKYKSERKE